MVLPFQKGGRQPCLIAYFYGITEDIGWLAKTSRGKHRIKLLEGKLKTKSHGASQHYILTFTTDETSKLVTAPGWEKKVVDGTMASHPGVYCLRK
jgi:hypothetical protein